MRKQVAKKKAPIPNKLKEKKFLTDVPRPDEDSLMEIFYGGMSSARADTPPPPAPAAQKTIGKGTVFLPVAGIDPDPGQPRKTFDAIKIEELADSIKTEGLLQPIVVRAEGDRYVIVAGERRFRAMKLLGRAEIEAEIFPVTAAQAFRLALIENVQRDSLLPIEEAEAYLRILEEQKITQADLARQMGVDRRRVSEKLALLRLPPQVQELLSARSDTFFERHALILAAAPKGTDVIGLAQHCADEGWSLPRLRAALEKPESTPGIPKLFQNLHVQMNRRGGFTLMVRARSRDEVATTIAELERTIDGLRESFVLSARADEAERSAAGQDV